MSKGKGQKIAIKFDKALLGDVTGLENPVNFKPADIPFAPATGHVFTASGQYSSYAPDRAFDGSTSTYWRASSTAAGQWLQIDLGEAITAAKFRWYVNSYRPRAFILQGSNNEQDWTTLHEAESPNTAGWHEFIFENNTAYRYYRWTLNSRWSSYYYIYEVELFGWQPVGNEGAFTITGSQRDPLKTGDLQPKTFQVARVERYKINDIEQPDTILLTFDTYNRFNDVEPDTQITVAYDQSKGTLTGTRPVESFSIPFTPADLEPTPIDEHTITAAIELTADFIELTHTDIHHKHDITAGIDLTAALINVDDINP